MMIEHFLQIKKKQDARKSKKSVASNIKQNTSFGSRQSKHKKSKSFRVELTSTKNVSTVCKCSAILPKNRLNSSIDSVTDLAEIEVNRGKISQKT